MEEETEGEDEDLEEEVGGEEVVEAEEEEGEEEVVVGGEEAAEGEEGVEGEGEEEMEGRGEEQHGGEGGENAAESLCIYQAMSINIVMLNVDTFYTAVLNIYLQIFPFVIKCQHKSSNFVLFLFTWRLITFQMLG